MRRERHDIAGGCGRVTVELTFDSKGHIVGLAVADVALRDDASARLAQRLERLGRRIGAEGLGPVVAEALHYWQLAERLQRIERERARARALP
jgi:hypothetical protein